MTLSYCGDLVRKHDPDRFLLGLFAPPPRREALWALQAFNYEIARTREVVTETKLGLIRLQWWRDAVARIYAGQPPLQNPVAEALAAAIWERSLPQEPFDSLIYAREFDLEDRPPASLEGMVKYAEFTAGPVMELEGLALVSLPPLPSGEGGGEGAAVERSALPAGVTALTPALSRREREQIAAAYALTGLLRAAPAHLRQRRCYLPADMIPPVEELYEGRALEKLKPAAEAVAVEAERLLSSCQPADRHTRLHAALARMYLAQIRKAGFDLFSPRLQIPPFMKEVRLLWAAV